MSNHRVSGIKTVTQTKVIDDLRQCVNMLENLNKMHVSDSDYYDICLAKNKLKTIIRINGIKV